MRAVNVRHVAEVVRVFMAGVVGCDIQLNDMLLSVDGVSMFVCPPHPSGQEPPRSSSIARVRSLLTGVAGSSVHLKLLRVMPSGDSEVVDATLVCGGQREGLSFMRSKEDMRSQRIRRKSDGVTLSAASCASVRQLRIRCSEALQHQEAYTVSSPDPTSIPAGEASPGGPCA